jgi:type II secretory pathway pseudopilin PulG
MVFVTAVLGAMLLALIASLPFLIWRRRGWWRVVAVGALWIGPLACLANDSVFAFCSKVGEVALGCLIMLAVPASLLLWRRTRRVTLVLLGAILLALFAFINYWIPVICTIGYVLLLLALWPCWRLLQAAPRGRERSPVIPSRGVLRVRSWPACRRSGMEGFSLITTLVGIAFVLIAAALATQAISATMLAVRHADHLAVATDLLESARERALLGRETDGIQAQAARLLPKGSATLTRTPAGPGLTRALAVATWEETNGRPGQMKLEWLTADPFRTPRIPQGPRGRSP